MKAIFYQVFAVATVSNTGYCRIYKMLGFIILDLTPAC